MYVNKKYAHPLIKYLLILLIYLSMNTEFYQISQIKMQLTIFKIRKITWPFFPFFFFFGTGIITRSNHPDCEVHGWIPNPYSFPSLNLTCSVET